MTIMMDIIHVFCNQIGPKSDKQVIFTTLDMLNRFSNDLTNIQLQS